MTKLLFSLEAGWRIQGHGAQHIAYMPSSMFNKTSRNKIMYNQIIPDISSATWSSIHSANLLRGKQSIYYLQYSDRIWAPNFNSFKVIYLHPI